MHCSAESELQMVQCSYHMVRREQMLAAVVTGKPTCQTMLLTPLIVTTHNFCKLVTHLFSMNGKRKKANLEISMLKILFFEAPISGAPIFEKGVNWNLAQKCGGNAKSHPTAKGRKQSNLWMVRTGQDAINQRTAESYHKYLWCWIGWMRLFFYDFLLLYDFKFFVHPSQVT